MLMMGLQQQQPRQAKQVRWRVGALLWGVLQVFLVVVVMTRGCLGLGGVLG